jgi:hypothetical protein
MSDFLKASRESTKDLILDAKLNNLSNSCIQKRPVSPKPIKNKRRYNTPIVESSDYVTNKDIRDLLFDSQLNTIANNASQGNQDYQPTKIVSPVTQEMIEEYKAQELQPIEVGGKKYKYHPSALAIDLDPYPPLPNKTYDGPALENLRQEVKLRAEDYTASQKKLEALDAEYEQLRKTYDELKPQYDRREAELNTLTSPKLRLDYPYASKFKTKVAIVEAILLKEFGIKLNDREFRYRVNVLSNQRGKVEAELANLDAIIQALNTDISENDAKVAENEAVIYATDKANKAKLDAYAQDLEGLNAGQMRFEQQNGESLDDYKARLISTGQTELSDADIESSANLQSIVKLKNNLKEISNEPSKIEYVTKTLSQDERIELNKIFPRFKKQFIDTYGVNNKAVSEDDIVEFAREILSTPAVPTSATATPISAAATATAVSTKAARSARDRIKEFGASNGIRFKSGDKLIEIIRKIEEGGLEVPANLTNDMRPSDVKACHDEGLLSYYSSPLSTPKKAGAGGAGGAEETKGEGIHKFSHGIPHYPKLTPFGKVMISPDKLYFKNILVIRNMHGKPLTGLTNTRVSDVMVSILMKCLEGNRISKSEINLLSKPERHLYDNLMYMSGGHKVHEHSMDKTSEEMKHRLSLIEGELEAGNNSELLKKELHGLLHRMAHNGLISVAHASAYYKEAKECYFGSKSRK